MQLATLCEDKHSTYSYHFARRSNQLNNVRHFVSRRTDIQKLTKRSLVYENRLTTDVNPTS
jgi:hypothetical protein